MSKKKSAVTADTSGLMVDRQIRELVTQESAAASHMADTSAADGQDLTLVQQAVLSMDMDIRNSLRLIQECRQKLDNFDTFMRAMSRDMADIKNAIKKELAHADRSKEY